LLQNTDWTIDQQRLQFVDFCSEKLFGRSSIKAGLGKNGTNLQIFLGIPRTAGSQNQPTNG
jgi:hypothetical protein